MSVGIKLLKEHKYPELWQRYCGFLDLSLPDFMGIQHHLLLEQIELLKGCELGQRLLGRVPRTVEEFRSWVPLTTYEDYAPYLLERREDVLPAKPMLWQRTSGASGEYPFKWAPITERMYQEMGVVLWAMLLLSTARHRGDINFGEGERAFYGMAPPPYATGCWGRRAAQELPVTFLPDAGQAEALSFEERLVLGLRQGLDQGIDLIFALPSVLVALGEQMGQRSQKLDGYLLSHPRALLRAGKAVAKSKLAHRPLRPRDLWSLRGVATAGSDASIYRKRIEQLWGQTPLDVYGSTEGLIIAMQTWDYQGMTFLPHLNLLEFIPESEHLRMKTEPGYKPHTVLLDEVEPGRNYEVVITNFLGGVFVRYRLGDMVTILSRRNERLNIDIPQMAFYSRCDGIIDLAGFARLTEKTIWQALEGADLACVGWTARKEASETPILRIYLELRGNGARSPDEIGEIIHQQLKRLDTPYAEMEAFLGLKPVKVTLLPEGSFRAYFDHQRAAGADLAHLKPPPINPSDAVLRALLPAVLEQQPVGVS